MVRWLPVYCYQGLLLSRTTLIPCAQGDVPWKGHLAGEQETSPVAGDDLENPLDFNPTNQTFKVSNNTCSILDALNRRGETGINHNNT